MRSGPDSLTLANVSVQLADHVADLCHLIVLDEENDEYGALWSPDYGMVDPKLTGHFIVGAGYLLLASAHLDKSASLMALDDLLERALAAADYLLFAQHDSGLIDLLSVNYDSGPDTAFTVQELCTLFELSRREPQAAMAPGWQALLEKLETFIRRAAPGMRDGGFHTPNHRWVIVSALVQAKSLFPDLVIQPAVENYLAEGFDIDDEGFFIERSVGVYDAVNDRSLLMIAEFGERPDAYPAVARNLDLNLHLIHADATAETGISRRQDYGTRQVPLALAHCYLLSNRAEANGLFVAAAQRLWSQADGQAEALRWLVYALLKCGDPGPATAVLPADFRLHLPANGLWRLRREAFSASLFRDETRLLTCIHGAAELSSLKISQAYFGQKTGRFIADTLHVHDGKVVLRSEGRANPRRPGYEQPLGRPVPPSAWKRATVDREIRWLPHPISELVITEATDAGGIGLDLHYRTLDGLPGVAVQIAFDFPPGGIWETGDTLIQPVAGQVIFLVQGQGTMRFGNDAIRIGPGTAAHSMWQMRDSESASDHVRVLFAMQTPVDYAFTIRCYRGRLGDPCTLNELRARSESSHRGDDSSLSAMGGYNWFV